MKRQWIFISIIISLMMLWTACEDWVNGVEPLIDKIEDSQLDNESQVDFMIDGVRARFSSTTDIMTILTGLLSDELFFSFDLPGASYPQYYDIDVGVITLDNNSIQSQLDAVGELRFFADDLVDRASNRITFTDQAKKAEAIYWGSFYGAVGRSYYASYFGLTEEEGGGTIDAGPFIPSDEMYALALEKCETALLNASDDWETSLVNSLMARLYLYLGDYSNAAAKAAVGLQEGDPGLEALYSDQTDNYWHVFGKSRIQFVPDARFHDYVVADPNEANRIPLVEIQGLDTTNIYYRQDLYQEKSSPINWLTWQEMALIEAECALRGAGSGDPVGLVNQVRDSHGIDPLGNVDMETIIVERDKELLTTGQRLVDQRRFDDEYGTWHLDDGLWMYLPITQNERNGNPNLD
ncbi:hypothetical protein HQ585_02180 [candidate division KSB1 bacterium]|nr:hypothetical protein [candidate division KSB1 bacterium]